MLKCAEVGISDEYVSRAEELIWPGKLLGVGVRNYIVPIQPRWAAHLFDEELASQDLFGAATRVAISYENVYYRGKVPRVLKAPGRVLWYVSGDRRYKGSRKIRAWSSLKEVVIDSAKNLFKRFEQLGMYEWRDVKAGAKGDANAQIMAERRCWGRDELVLAFNLYCRMPFGRMHRGNADVVRLAKLIGRTPSANGRPISGGILRSFRSPGRVPMFRLRRRKRSRGFFGRGRW